MLFPRFLFAFCKISIFESSHVSCNQTSGSDQRKLYAKALENEGEIFVPVSYNSVNQQSYAERSNLKSILDRNMNRIVMPVVIFQADNSSNINIHQDSVIISISGYERKSNNLTENSEETSRKVFWFHKNGIPENSTEIVLFQACRMFKTRSGIDFEESILIITDGIFNETGSYRKLTQNLEETIYFKYPEIDDENFCICRHLEFYFNQCHRNYGSKRFLVLFLSVAVIVVVKSQKLLAEKIAAIGMEAQ
jgi:hypothetical protein